MLCCATTSRPIVEDQHFRRVEERRNQFHLHPLAERQFSHRLGEKLANAEQVDQFVLRLLERRRFDPVDFLMELE